MGLSLNIDTCSTSFYKSIPAVQFVKECLLVTNPTQPFSDRDRLKIKKALRGVRVETTHQQGKRSIYKITGITSVPLEQLSFPCNDGTQLTVVQYFKQRYKYMLQYTAWPCLQFGNDSKPIYLPMEVCEIIEGQKYSRKLSDTQVASILKATCKRPQERENNIIQMVGHNNYSADRLTQMFGITVANQMANVQARVLPPPLLKYHESGREKTVAPSIGQWNMINKKMVNGGTVHSWTCLSFSRMPRHVVDRICDDLVQMCNSIGMVFNPRPVIDQSASPNHIEAALRDVHTRAPNLQLLIVILPDVSGHYGKIKRLCETELDIVSQCINPKPNKNKQYFKNVALKINVKRAREHRKRPGSPPDVSAWEAQTSVPPARRSPTVPAPAPTVEGPCEEVQPTARHPRRRRPSSASGDAPVRETSGRTSVPPTALRRRRRSSSASGGEAPAPVRETGSVCRSRGHRPVSAFGGAPAAATSGLAAIGLGSPAVTSEVSALTPVSAELLRQRPARELCIIDHSTSIANAEAELHRAILITVVGTRPTVSA
ncbi:hypothetical protein C2845_PM03G22140 [Panicum miliaceum]|uniref:PAZ domain-containing protein n=1 Tax=Panicum miliaceum TaxID=4540 RepID=A0A3L6T821_PANMI|nr:hypothetical protein C2845_PM03G22140 [Panicum miliaceum]